MSMTTKQILEADRHMAYIIDTAPEIIRWSAVSGGGVEIEVLPPETEGVQDSGGS